MAACFAGDSRDSSLLTSQIEEITKAEQIKDKIRPIHEVHWVTGIPQQGSKAIKYFKKYDKQCLTITLQFMEIKN